MEEEITLEEYIENIFYFLDDIDDFDYHAIAPYIIDILPAFLLVQNMIKNCIKRFKHCVENAKQYTEIDELFDFLNIAKVIQDTDEIVEIVDSIYDMIKEFFTKKETSFQKKLGEI